MGLIAIACRRSRIITGRSSASFNASGWAQVRCVFHEDGHASLSIHREFGAFRSFARDARGGDTLAFEMLRSGADFKSAARALGAWR